MQIFTRQTTEIYRTFSAPRVTPEEGRGVTRSPTSMLKWPVTAKTVNRNCRRWHAESAHTDSLYHVSEEKCSMLNSISNCIYINLYSPFNVVETTTEKKTKTFTANYYDSDITCPEISSDDEQAGHSANQSKTLPDIEQQPSCISLVLNNFMKSLFITKSSDLNWYWYSGKTSKP